MNKMKQIIRENSMFLLCFFSSLFYLGFFSFIFTINNQIYLSKSDTKSGNSNFRNKECRVLSNISLVEKSSLFQILYKSNSRSAITKENSFRLLRTTISSERISYDMRSNEKKNIFHVKGTDNKYAVHYELLEYGTHRYNIYCINDLVLSGELNNNISVSELVERLYSFITESGDLFNVCQVESNVFFFTYTHSELNKDFQGKNKIILERRNISEFMRTNDVTRTISSLYIDYSAKFDILLEFLYPIFYFYKKGESVLINHYFDRYDTIVKKINPSISYILPNQIICWENAVRYTSKFTYADLDPSLLSELSSLLYQKMGNNTLYISPNSNYEIRSTLEDHLKRMNIKILGNSIQVDSLINEFEGINKIIAFDDRSLNLALLAPPNTQILLFNYRNSIFSNLTKRCSHLKVTHVNSIPDLTKFL